MIGHNEGKRNSSPPFSFFLPEGPLDADLSIFSGKRLRPRPPPSTRSSLSSPPVSLSLSLFLSLKPVTPSLYLVSLYKTYLIAKVRSIAVTMSWQAHTGSLTSKVIEVEIPSLSIVRSPSSMAVYGVWEATEKQWQNSELL